MRISDFEKEQQKDKIEITKQQQAEIQKIFDSRIIPHENHTLFEVDLKTNEIRLAEFDKKPEIKWEDAVKGLISVKKTATKKENCIYISALNEKNARKILKRDFNIVL
jgi:hypothetical protein